MAMWLLLMHEQIFALNRRIYIMNVYRLIKMKVKNVQL